MGAQGFGCLPFPCCVLWQAALYSSLSRAITLSYFQWAMSTSGNLTDEEEKEFSANLWPELETPVLIQAQKKAVRCLVIPLSCNPSPRICLVSLFHGAQNTSHMLSH